MGSPETTKTHRELAEKIVSEIVFLVRVEQRDKLVGTVEKLLDQNVSQDLSFADLSQANATRCETSYHPLGDWSITDWLTAVAGEVGELAKELEPHPAAYYLALCVQKSTGYLANAIKHVRRGETEGYSKHIIKATNKEDIGREAADVVIYLDILCTRFGIDLGHAVRNKFNEVSDRVSSDIRL